jgi:hypothetical protein
VQPARVATVVAAVVLALTALAQPAAARVPTGFVGVTADGPLLDSSVDLGHELDLMKAAGVQTVRVTFPWNAAQPYPSFADAPPAADTSFTDVGGVPTDYSATDRLVRATAERGQRLLPVVLYSPPWDSVASGRAVSPPTNPIPLARYLGALVRRYGPGGGFWAENPSLAAMPVRDWQIWNEPNITHYWPAPFARGYVKLLRAAHTELKRDDPAARLVLAGLTNDSWNALRLIYKAGGRPYFDVVAIHPYTRHVPGLAQILTSVRYWMGRSGDGRKPIVVSELSWPSALGRVPQLGFNEVTEAQQASRVTRAYELLAKYRSRFQIEGAYWYTWLSTDSGGYYFDYSGLRKLTPSGPVAKPAYRAFRRVALKLER